MGYSLLVAFRVIQENIYFKIIHVDYVSMGILFRIKIVLNVILNVKHVMDQLLTIAFRVIQANICLKTNNVVFVITITLFKIKIASNVTLNVKHAMVKQKINVHPVILANIYIKITPVDYVKKMVFLFLIQTVISVIYNVKHA